MRCACIDIGTNTTRVLVADAGDGRVAEVLQQKAFTRLGRDLVPGGRVREAKVRELAAVVAAQRALAVEAGATALRVVATAALRSAANQGDVCAAVRAACGDQVVVLDGEEEARLAFLGATRTFGAPLPRRVAVVDVGGGSTEIAVGEPATGVEWSASFPVGSGIGERHLPSDPPAESELADVRAHARAAFAGGQPPPVQLAIAVGGSAASLRRLVGDVLEPASLERALAVLAAEPAEAVARRAGLEVERVRLLPAGLLVLEAAAECLGHPLVIGRGGLREGVLLELAAAG